MNNSEELNGTRRIWLRTMAGISVAAPLGMLAGEALSAQNGAVRQALKYQETPNAGKQCSACAQFVPGKTPTERGGCTVIAGDTEIAPTGYCVAWIEGKKK